VAVDEESGFMKTMRFAPWLALIVLLAPPVARADLYAAEAAAGAKDFPRAFELFRELAELGHTRAQENLAVMYVNGEGVKRDNVLGYAWAALAKEGGGGEAAAGIIAQLDPHMNAAARARVAELQAQFGKAALQERLLPKPYVPGTVGKRPCGMRSVVDPNAFYPVQAKRQEISGTVLVEARVAPDGRARNVRALYSLPAGVFDEAGRRVALANTYSPPVENGVAVACTIRFKVNFSIRYESGRTAALTVQPEILSDIRSNAEAGDPRSQLNYGLALETRSELNIDKERPADWYLKAAQGGIPTAQFLVGRQLIIAAEAGLETDDRKGLTWLQMAADAGQVDAQTVLASYLLRKNTADAPMRAQALLDQAAASGHRDGKFYLAGLLATGPDATRRDPRRALELLEQVKSELDYDPMFFEVRAAANAQLGDFAKAQEDQKLALQKAKKLGWNTKDQQARLESYAASKPWTGNLFAF
jgi:TonB family protein